VTNFLCKGSGQAIFVSHVTSNVSSCDWQVLVVIRDFGHVVYFIVVSLALEHIKLLSVPTARTKRHELGMTITTDNSFKATYLFIELEKIKN